VQSVKKVSLELKVFHQTILFGSSDAEKFTQKMLAVKYLR
jgi:uncharacterized protein YigA (DUF484 family)